MSTAIAFPLRKRLGILAAALAVMIGVVTPATDSEAATPVDSVWNGGWAAENGSFDSRSSLGSWTQVQSNSTRVTQLWKAGAWGQGVGVAVIDTGSLPVAGLTNRGTIVNGLDISFDSQNPEILHLDGYGHGVHMAGLIAGSSSTKTPRREDHKEFTGMAPSAHVISVKVGASDGAVDVSQVIAAIDWVVEHKDDRGLNIRVLNLSFGFDSVQNAQRDPLSHAVENAWKAGIVVVAAAGNDGNRSSLRMPARNPFVIAVGSYEQGFGVGGTPVSDFSNCGDGTRSVDVVAPGRSIISLRAPGSYLDENYPNARAGQDFFKGSGTSQSAAIVSGGVAALLSLKPDLSPDEVKNMLMDTARPVIGSELCAGAGAVNFEAVRWARTDSTPQPHPASTGDGSLDAARGTMRLQMNGVPATQELSVVDQPLDNTTVDAVLSTSPDTSTSTSLDAEADSISPELSEVTLTDTFGLFDKGTVADSTDDSTLTKVAIDAPPLEQVTITLDGEQDIFGNVWDGPTWAKASTSGSSWNGGSWNGNEWAGQSWAGSSWSGLSWSGLSWSGLSWSGLSWSGLSWSGRSWSGLSWSGLSWSSGTWSGLSWSGLSWSSLS